MTIAEFIGRELNVFLFGTAIKTKKALLNNIIKKCLSLYVFLLLDMRYEIFVY